MNISEELFYEIVDDKYEELTEVSDAIYSIHHNMIANMRRSFNDFFFMCKKWALGQGYKILTDSGENTEDLSCAIVCNQKKSEVYVYYEDYQGTEQQATFNACQWILENKK